MIGDRSCPTIPLPKQWPSRVRSGVLHAASLAHFSLTYTCASRNFHPRLEGRLDRVSERCMSGSQVAWSDHSRAEDAIDDRRSITRRRSATTERRHSWIERMSGSTRVAMMQPANLGDGDDLPS